MARGWDGTAEKGKWTVSLQLVDRHQGRRDSVKGASKPPRIYLLKNRVFILTCFNLGHLQSTLHLMHYTYQDVFSTAQNSF